MQQDVRTLLRWYSKKVARYSMALVTWGSGWLALRRRVSRKARVRVLMYHRFRNAPYDPFSISTAAFARQMEWIGRHKLAISLADLQAFLAGQCDLPDRAVLVTIDDGYHDFWSQAVPILHRWHIPAVAFVPAGEIASRDHRDQSHTAPLDDNQRLCWEEVVALPTYGITVGSHSWEHASLGRMDKAQIEFQTYRSRQELENHLRSPITTFAYPFGTWADFNEVTKHVLCEVGYSCAFTAQHGAIQLGSDPYALPRVKVEGGEGLWMFKLLLKGGLDLWGWIDRSLWYLQQSAR